jgi:hypothetical protein
LVHGCEVVFIRYEFNFLIKRAVAPFIFIV